MDNGERIQALIDLSKWSLETTEFTSDSEDYRVIKRAIGLMAYHIGVEAGRQAIRLADRSPHALATVIQVDDGHAINGMNSL